MKTYPLNSSQLGIFYEWEKNRSLMQYNLPYVYRFAVTIDTRKLHAALQKIVATYPIFSTRFIYVDDEIRQYIHENTTAEISIPEFSAAESEIEKVFRDFVKPFDLLNESLCRFQMVRSEAAVYFLLDLHHAVFDGTSSALFTRALNSAYLGEELPVETFTLFAVIEEEEKNIDRDAAQFAADEEFFASRLSGISMTPFPQAKRGLNGSSQSQAIFFPRRRINSFCAKNHAEPNSFFLTALALCLSRFTREENVLLSTAHHGRVDKRFQETFGMFVRTVPLALHIDAKKTAQEQIAALRQELSATFEHLRVPFAHLARKHGLELNILYVFQRGISEEGNIGGEKVRVRHLPIARVADNITIFVFEIDGQYEFRLEYNDAILTEAEAKLFIEAVEACVESMLRDANQLCQDVEIVSESHKKTLAQFEYGEKRDYDKSLTMLDLLAAQVAKTPDAVAVVFGEKTLTYKKLDAITTRIAKYLVKLGVGLEQAVGVMIERSELLAIYPIAILKAGAAYMPLDFHFPADRLSFMVNDANVKIILTDEKNRVTEAIPDFTGVVLERFSELSTCFKEVAHTEAQRTQRNTVTPLRAFVPSCEEKGCGVNEAELAEISLPVVKPENMFVILYTSGSTGQPKGVILEHRNLVNYNLFAPAGQNLTAQDRVAGYTNNGFDMHMFDLFNTLTVGASVYYIPSEMRLDLARLNAYIEENQLTVVFLTTMIGKQFIDLFDNKSLRMLTVAGEKLPPVSKPRYDLVNGYGPTETTLYATAYDIKKDYDSSNVGNPSTNYSMYVCDANMQPLPPGAYGELCIGGAGVGRGYLNRPELTAEKFITLRGERFYRTGDLVRWNEDGDLEYAGRIDTQVKLRGLRIELGEIEAVIGNYPNVQDAVVCVQEIGGTAHLVGYFTATETIEPEQVRAFLANTLTEFMIPTMLMQLEKIPLTPNGKVNRKLLPKPILATGPVKIAETELQQQMINIAAELVGIKSEELGIDTSLIAAGMSSLVAIKFAAKLSREFNCVVSGGDILRTRTIEALEKIVVETRREESDSTDSHATENIDNSANVPREFYPLSPSQLGVYLHCAKEPTTTLYNLPHLLCFDNQAKSPISAEKLRAAYLKVLAAHPSLKTHLVMQEREIAQTLGDFSSWDLEIQYCSERDIYKILENFRRPFSLFTGPLFRAEIYVTETQTYLLLDFHHLIFDGASVEIFLSELAAAYSGVEVAQEEYSAGAVALAAAAYENNPTFAVARERDAAFFRECFAQVDEATAIPFDTHNVDASSESSPDALMGIADFYLERKLIADFCNQHDLTPAGFFLGTLALVASGFANQKDLLIFAISAGRDDLQTQRTLGMLVKTLPVTISVDANLTAAEFLAVAQQNFFDFLAHQKYPFQQMVDEYKFKPQLVYAFQGGLIGGKYSFGGAHPQIKMIGVPSAKFPLSVHINSVYNNDEAEKFHIALQYDKSLYQSETMQTFGESFADLAQRLANNEATRGESVKPTTVKQLKLITKNQEQELRKISGSVTENDVPNLHSLLEKLASEKSDACALIAIDQTLSFGEFNVAANKLAHGLIARGVIRGDCVAILLPRDSRVLVAMFGILKTGAAYIPIDLEYPAARIEQILSDSGAKFVIVDDAAVTHEGMRSLTQRHGGTKNFNAECMESLDAPISGVPDSPLRAFVPPCEAKNPANDTVIQTVNGYEISNSLQFDEVIKSSECCENPNLKVLPDDVAYLIYTSGSTGRPKGVVLLHRGIVNYVLPRAANRHVMSLMKNNCQMLSITTVSFDMFLKEAFTTLLNGLVLVLASSEQARNPGALTELFMQTGANAFNATPSRLQQFLEDERLASALAKCRVIMAGGEAYPGALYKKLCTLAPQTILINTYGPTEITVSSNGKILDGENVTIGAPLHNVVESVRDFAGRELPIGVIGELWIGGAGVAQGYYRLEEMTRERFVTENGERYYKSGDRAKWNDRGEIVVLGRNDRQVKLRGLRIELEEIENALQAIPGIKTALVQIREVEGREHIVAWYLIDNHDKTAAQISPESLSPEILREKLAATLPTYMLPTAWCELEKIPLTPNGKVDYENFPAPQLLARQKYEHPKNKTEEKLQQIFCAVLNLEQVSVTDNFFDLGGTSLMVTRVLTAVQAHGFSVNYGDVFQKPTPRQLAQLVQSQQAENVGGASKIISSRGESSSVSATHAADGFDYTAINKLLARNTLESFKNGKAQPLGNVLLTGATGFLGIHVLREILLQKTGTVYCLVRAEKGSAEERLQNLLFYYFENTFAELFGARIVVCAGDVESNNSLAQLEKYPINTVINCAANVKHFSAGSDIEDVNFGGIVNLIDLCKKIGARLVQVSTTSIAGLSINNSPPATTVMNERQLWLGQDLSQQYVGSKFRAERAALAAMSDDPDNFFVKIMRVGNLMGRHQDGEFQINSHSNSFVGRLHAYAVIGCVPYDILTLPTEFAPIDCTAEAIVQLAETPRECVVFHPYNDHYVFIGDVLDALNRRGLNINFVETAEFEAAIRRALQNPAQANLLTPIIAYLNQAQGRQVVPLKTENNYTSQILRRLNFHWPITSATYLDKFIEGLRGLDFFE